MPDSNVRGDSVNVEQIMDQIRARIREKHGVDDAEPQMRELLPVKLEKFLDPQGGRSNLLDEFRKVHAAYEPLDLPSDTFQDTTLYQSHRGLLRVVRRLLNPILKLFFNPNALVQALHAQSRLNERLIERDAKLQADRQRLDTFHVEVMHTLVLEMMRLSRDVKNLKMQVESVSSRQEFNERRSRALESAVQHHPAQAEVPHHAATSEVTISTPPLPPREGQMPGGHPESPGQRSRRRRRRRGRRGTAGPPSAVMGQPTASASADVGAQPAATAQAADSHHESASEPSSSTGHDAGPPDSNDQ